MSQKEFKIYFQPKINGKDQTISSAEVLVRWQRDADTIWYPDMFLPILEETGEIQALDYYVYETAFQWMSERKRTGQKILPLSLNVSPVHFRNISRFTFHVEELINKYGIDPSDLIFEITETTYIHNIESVNQMIRFFHKKRKNQKSFERLL